MTTITDSFTAYAPEYIARHPTLPTTKLSMPSSTAAPDITDTASMRASAAESVTAWPRVSNLDIMTSEQR